MPQVSRRTAATRASDVDRKAVLEALRAANMSGQLGPAEYTERVARARGAKTLGTLDKLVTDLQQAPTLIDHSPISSPVPVGGPSPSDEQVPPPVEPRGFHSRSQNSSIVRLTAGAVALVVLVIASISIVVRASGAPQAGTYEPAGRSTTLETLADRGNEFALAGRDAATEKTIRDLGVGGTIPWPSGSATDGNSVASVARDSNGIAQSYRFEFRKNASQSASSHATVQDALDFYTVTVPVAEWGPMSPVQTTDAGQTLSWGAPGAPTSLKVTAAAKDSQIVVTTQVRQRAAGTTALCTGTLTAAQKAVMPKVAPGLSLTGSRVAEGPAGQAAATYGFSWTAPAASYGAIKGFYQDAANRFFTGEASFAEKPNNGGFTLAPKDPSDQNRSLTVTSDGTTIKVSYQTITPGYGPMTL